jgi:RNA polymerase sigma-70 factor, ECF subfamily
MDTALVEDADLVERLRAGDEAAVEHLVRSYTGRLLAVTRRILPTDEEARDAVQDAFLLAFRGLGRFQGGSRLSTWLHRIAVNAALMRLRTRRRKPEEPLDSLLPTFRDDGHHQEAFRSWAEPVDQALERAETRALVRRLINQLPESYRTVLLLRDIEGLDTDETATALGLTPNAVKIRLHRARQALRTLLSPHLGRGTT